jgi:two-component system sensor histidine kinase YesM
MQNSLRVKVILAFMLVVIPILALTVYIGLYSISVVRAQVSQSNHNILNLYAAQIERTLDDVNTYLNKISSVDSDLRALNVYSMDSPDYILAKYSLSKKLNLDNEYYQQVDSFFVLRNNPLDVIETNWPITAEQRNKRHEFLQKLLVSSPQAHWQVYVYDNSYVLIKIMKVNSTVYIGAWIQLDELKIPLDLLNLGDAGKAVLLSENNEIVADMTGGHLVSDALVPAPQERGSDDMYRIWQDQDGRKYMLVSHDLSFAHLRLAVALLEEDVLERLPLFLKLIFVLPVAVLSILLLYLLFFQKFLLLPLFVLVRGMREVAKGNFKVRIEAKQQGEFGFLIQSFNDTIDKIKTLQIDVYEEKLRNQRAEMKHLQLQIQPHFYLNCLNIIYSLADLRKYEQIQSMAQYLSDYFRFTLYYSEAVALAKEVEHIRIYLEIQRFRYPNRLTYSIRLDEPFAQFELPPLLILPFVENSIKHGMKSDRPLFIGISSYKDERKGNLVVEIADNGRGFPGKLLDQQLSPEYDPGHVGIWNVKRRMQVHFGEQAALKLTNGAEGGAVIQLTLPLEAGAEPEKEASHV